jgi:hypothetical protein
MSKRRPDPDKIANELADGSAYFRKSAAPPAVVPPSETAPAPASDPAPSPVARTPDRPGRLTKRHMIRHAFELYMDQLDRLRELADEQRRRGEPASMSRMVREAIDRYLDDQPRAS